MSNNIQHIRRSQFVLSLGPGAIIEGKNGPRIIRSIEYGLEGDLLSQDVLEKSAIGEYKLIKSIRTLIGAEVSRQDNLRVFSLPSNASLGYKESKALYHTDSFPEWRLCYGRSGNHNALLYNGAVSRACPKCTKVKDTTSVRFVAACINGHLDDVDWESAVHGQKRPCQTKYYYWNADGSALSNIRIKCPKCGAQTTMFDVYTKDFNCTGRLPEKAFGLVPKTKAGRSKHSGRKTAASCTANMKVVQRQASSLRIPDIVTLLTIPEYKDPVSNVILNNVGTLTDIFDILDLPDPSSGNSDQLLVQKLSKMSRINNESRSVMTQYIETAGAQSFIKRFNDLQQPNNDFLDFIYDELKMLLHAPGNAEKKFSLSSPVRCVFDCNGAETSLKVSGVNDITTVTAQIGYKRLPYIKAGEQPKRVSSGAKVDDTLWYPGFEGSGEAVFITFEKGDRPDLISGDAYSEWKGQEVNIPEYGLSSLLYGMIRVDEPLFVWLHTLSHFVIKALSLYTGYSAPSLRERVYIDREGENGGILIYTTSAGDDGSMGGLTGMVDNFSEVLNVVSENMSCSNDPLCSDVRRKDHVNGAACYSCLFTSETSCEHGNLWLDRHIVLGD